MLDKIIFFLYSSLFLLTPFLMSPLTSELFEFNKMIFIYFIAVLVIFFWLIKCLLKKQFFWVRTVFDLAILLFLSSQILATIFSIDIHTSIIGYYGRFNGGLLSLFTYLSLFYILIIFFDFDKLEKMLKLSVLTSLVTILWGLPGKFGFDLSCLVFVGQFGNNCWTDQFRPAERMFSTLGQPNWLGAYLAINFFIAAYFFLRALIKLDKNKSYSFSSIYYAFYLVLNFLAVVFTRSRSALAALAIGIFFLVIYVFFKAKNIFYRNIWKIYGAVILFLMLIFVIIFKTGIDKIDNLLTIKFPEKTKTASSTNIKTNVPVKKDNVTNSLDIRKIVWQGAWDLGKKYPVFGTGLETFAYSYYFVRPTAHNLTSEWDYLYNRAHNEYLNYLATTGFVGLASYLLLIFLTSFLFMRQFIKEKNPLDKLFYLCIFLSYLTILITNCVGFSTTTINLFFYLIPGFYLLKEKENDKQIKRICFNFDSQSGFNYYFLQPTVWILTMGFLLFSLRWLVFYYLADLKYAEANNLSKMNRLQESANDLNESIKLHYEHVYEDKLSNVLANLAYIASYQRQKDLSEKLVNLSQYYNEKSVAASSQNVLYWKTKAKNQYLFYQIGLDQKEMEKGIQALKKAQKLAPTDAKIPYNLALFYSLLYDETAALNAIDQSIVLKSDYYDGYFFKGQLLKKYKENKEAKKVFELMLNKFNPQDQEVKKELEGL